MTTAIPLVVGEPARLSPAAAAVLARIIRSASDHDELARMIVDHEHRAAESGDDVNNSEPHSNACGLESRSSDAGSKR